MTSLRNLLIVGLLICFLQTAEAQGGLTFNFKAGGGMNHAQLVGQSFSFGFKKYISKSTSLGASYNYFHCPVQQGYAGQQSSLVHSFRILTSAHLIKAEKFTFNVELGPVFSEWQETLKTPENSGGYLQNFGLYGSNEYHEIHYSRWGFFGGAEMGYQISDMLAFIFTPSYQFDFKQNNILKMDIGFEVMLN